MIDPHFAEDAFIYFRYVANFIDGYGFNFNEGERVEGYTSLLWVFVLSIFSLLAPSIQSASIFLSIVSFMVLSFALQKIVLQRESSREYFTFLIILLLSNYSFVYTIFSGLDHILFAALFYCCLYFESRDTIYRRSNYRLFCSVLLWSMLILTRPEGIALYLICLVCPFLWMLFGRHAMISVSRTTILFCLMPIAIYCIHIGIRYWYYGFVFPNTFYVKVDGDLFSGIYEGIRYQKNFWFRLEVLVPTVIFTFSAIRYIFYKVGSNYFDFVCFLLIGFWLSYIAYVGGDWIPGYRNILFIFPLMMIFSAKKIPEKYFWKIVAGLSVMAMVIWAYKIVFGDSSHSFLVGMFPQFNLLWAYGLLGLVIILFFVKLSISIKVAILGCFFSLGAGMALFRPEVASLAIQNNIVAYLSGVGRLFGEALPKSVTLALNPAGAVPFYSKMKVIDLLGLNDSEIAHHVPESRDEQRNLNHDKSHPDYVLTRSPELILLGLYYLSEVPLDQGDLRFARYRSDRDLLAHAEFKENYSLVNLGPLSLTSDRVQIEVGGFEEIPVQDSYLNVFVRSDFSKQVCRSFNTEYCLVKSLREKEVPTND